MEYLSKLIKEQKEKSESKKVAKFTAQLERDIVERNTQRNRRLTEINREIRSLNGIIQSLNTSYTTKLKPTLNLPKAPNTKIFISDALKKAVDDNRIEVVRREDERDRLNDEKRNLEAEIARERNEDDQIRRETEAEINEIMARHRGKGGATNKRRRKMRGGKTKRRRTLKKRRPRKTQRRPRY
jgi:chromosome segregation ATPase